MRSAAKRAGRCATIAEAGVAEPGRLDRDPKYLGVLTIDILPTVVWYYGSEISKLYYRLQ